MVVKILIWLEGFSPQFANAKSISEKTDYDLYAIINVNRAKPFYQNQKFIEFKKSWYYRDCFKKKFKDPDLNYLSKFEKEYNISLWQLAYSDINFNKFNKYYRFSASQILSIFEQECRFFEEVLDEINPNFLLIRLTDDQGSQLLQQMCNARGIRTLTQEFSRLGLRETISSAHEQGKIPEPGSLETVNSHKKNETDKKFTFEELQNYSQKYVKQESVFRENYKTSKLNWLKGAIQYLKMLNDPKYNTYYVNHGKNIASVIKNESSFFLKKKSMKSFLDRYAKWQINPNEKFVYFPLQLEPERTLLIPAPFYSNQLDVISNIARSLPIDFKLYVKEHPMQVVYAWRDSSYYRKILDLPNVELIHPDFSNKTLLENCSVVITITGTLGLEASFHGKPTIVFSDTVYSELPSVHRIANYEELQMAIKKSLKQEVKIDDVNSFVNRIMNNSFEFDNETLLVLFNNEFYYGGFLFDHDVPISKAGKFLDKYKEFFDKLADEHIKKIDRLSSL